MKVNTIEVLTSTASDIQIYTLTSQRVQRLPTRESFKLAMNWMYCVCLVISLVSLCAHNVDSSFIASRHIQLFHCITSYLVVSLHHVIFSCFIASRHIQLFHCITPYIVSLHHVIFSCFIASRHI